MPEADALIGPLTAAEWCSLRLGSETDALQCCGVTSDFRDALFCLLGMGADKGDAWVLPEAWHAMAEHGWPGGDPVIDKIRAYYGPEIPAPEPVHLPGDNR